MAGKFVSAKFSEINLSDPFFNSLKSDYPEFSSWFKRKAEEKREALVFSDDLGLGAFVATKNECEPLQLKNAIIPAKPRLKITTLYLADRFRGQRLGEGAIGLILWQWQQLNIEEIYVTVFPTHLDVLQQLYRFGFVHIGENNRGEFVLIRSRKSIDYSDPYKSFPYLSRRFQKGGYLIVEDSFHDTLFPYSELKNTIQEQLAVDAANGISKIYIGNQPYVHYQIGEPVFIYRKFTGEKGKRFKSCLTSYCIVSGITQVKKNNIPLIDYNGYLDVVGNKSVFTNEELWKKYYQARNLMVIQLLYVGYFGQGNNVNMDWLDNNGLWALNGGYPTETQLQPDQCEKIWQQGGLNLINIYGA